MVEKYLKKMMKITNVALLVQLTTINVLALGEIPDEWHALMTERDIIFAGILGVATLTSLLILIIHMVKLASMSSHPILRREAMLGVIWSGVITAILGAIDIIYILVLSSMF